MVYWILGIAAFLILVVVAYLLMIRPQTHRKNLMKNLLGWDYAHRGLHNAKNRIFENTLEAFSLAVQNGYGMELDVQFTKDHQLVVFHDYNLLRICGVDKRVDELTYEEISKLPIKGSPSRIPLFQDVLDTVAGKTPIIIEIKSEKRSSEICRKTNEILQSYKGVYCVESFNAFIVYWYAKNRPNMVYGQLSMNFMKMTGSVNWWQRFLLTHLLINFLERPDFVAYNHPDAGNLSLQLCKRLYKLVCVAWTIRSQEEYNKARGFFDIIIFEGFLPK
jgi:glycerophosphoryl diester phosphodiesterase